MARVLALLALTLGTDLAFAQGPVELVSQSTAGVPSTGISGGSVISADGRHVVFLCSDDLAPGSGTSGVGDLYVRDLVAHTTERMTLTWNGEAPEQAVDLASISHDGRYVCFRSSASNMVSFDGNGSIADLFVRDRHAGTTFLATLTSAGTPIKARVDGGSIASASPWVVFETIASNVVPDDDNGISDVFVRNFITGEVERVSERGDGSQAQAPSRYATISADGSIVAFACSDRLLPEDTDGFEDVYVFDRQSRRLQLASRTFDGGPSSPESTVPVISLDGRTVAFASNDSRLIPDDTNAAPDVFWCDLASGVVGRASVTSTGAQLPGIQNGYLAYSWYPSISGDGRIVGFWSTVTGVVPNVPAFLPAFGRVYTHDRMSGATTLVDTAWNGAPGDNDCDGTMSISADGSWVAWTSGSNNLVGIDSPGGDVFARQRAPNAPTSYCRPKVNSLGCSSYVESFGTPSIGSGMPFTLTASNMIGGSTGFFFYGLTPQNAPFAGGSLCVAPPVYTTDYAGVGGTPGTCTGSLSVDFNAIVRSGLDPSLTSGAVVFAQFCYRDHGDPTGLATGLSGAVTFTIRP